MREFSVSAARAARGCLRRYWLEYVARVRVEQQSEPSAARGIVMHAGLAAGYTTAARNRDVWPSPGDAELARRARDALDAAIDTEAVRVGMTDEDADEAAQTAAYALTQLGPRPGDEVLAVEHTLRVTVAEQGRQVPLKVRVDAVYARAGRVVLRDWKSSSTLPRARDLPRNHQLLVGALAAAREFGATELSVEIASIGAGVAVSSPVTREQTYAAAHGLADEAIVADNARTFPPRLQPDCETCPVRSHCPLFATGPIPTPDAHGEPVSPVRSTS